MVARVCARVEDDLIQTQGQDLTTRRKRLLEKVSRIGVSSLHCYHYFYVNQTCSEIVLSDIVRTTRRNDRTP
jgi:hypothetical protein